MNKFFKKILILLAFCPRLEAGQIRSIEATAEEMTKISLKLGQSTVLRFKEKPKKVIIGNQNYFNIEFVGNDVTIQPLSSVTTNLFVYGEFHTFGFILSVGQSSRYDDLVRISWRSKNQAPFLKREGLLDRRIDKTIETNEKISFKIARIQEIKKNFFVLDIDILNKSKSSILSKDIDIFLSRRKIKLPRQRLILAGQKIEPGLGIRSRVFIKLDEKRGFTVHFRYLKSTYKTIISRSYLKQ